jgi:hypothetical protein
MKWLPFVEGCRSFFDAGRENSLFPRVEAIDAVYRIAPEKSPFSHSKSNDESSDSFDRCFFVCHRAFLSSAMATASSLPKDGEAITRRALEAAKTVLAIKADAANGEIWQAAPARVKRWQQRGQKENPNPLRLHYKNVHTEPLYQELQAEIGALSDFFVHFTPEYFGRYTWEEKQRADGGFDISFGLPEGAIELGFLMLSKHHELIFRAVNRCQDGKMLRHPEVAQALDLVYELHEHYRQLVNPALDAMLQKAKP